MDMKVDYSSMLLEPVVQKAAEEKSCPDRMHLVFAWAAGRLGLDPCDLARECSIQDWKGLLTVFWTSPPTPERVKAFEDAWVTANELAMNVEWKVVATLPEGGRKSS